MKSTTIDWLKASEDDLAVISHIISDSGLTHIVAFHAQQSIEKALKDEIIAALENLYIEARYPGSLGMLPEGKPGIDDAKLFQETAIQLHKKIKEYLSSAQ